MFQTGGSFMKTTVVTKMFTMLMAFLFALSAFPITGYAEEENSKNRMEELAPEVREYLQPGENVADILTGDGWLYVMTIDPEGGRIVRLFDSVDNKWELMSSNGTDEPAQGIFNDLEKGIYTTFKDMSFAMFKEGTKINIVNDNIYPYSGTVDSFLQDRNIYQSTSGTGNASYTDFKLIFEKIIQAQKPGNVSVLVTDLIYSPQNTADVSVEKLLNEENSVATSIFKTYKGKSIIVNKLMGDYNGQYYPYNGAPFSYNGKRPFYLIIVADAATIDRMAADDNYAKFLHPSGAVNSYRFNQAQANINFKLVPDWKDNVGRFRPDHGDASSLTHCEGDRETGVLCFTLAANLKALNKDDAFLTNTANYAVQSQCGFEISIRPIVPADVTNNNRTYLDGMTHLITAKGKFNISRDQLSITLNNHFPQWINESSATTDTNPSDPTFSTTTFGLNRFLQGIYDAFSAGNDSYANIVVKLED